MRWMGKGRQIERGRGNGMVVDGGNFTNCGFTTTEARACLRVVSSCCCRRGLGGRELNRPRWHGRHMQERQEMGDGRWEMKGQG